MAFEPGNKLWMLRETHGRDTEYEKVEDLIEGIISYTDWVQENPWYRTEQLKKPVLIRIDEKGNKIYQTVTNIPTARPMSLRALCDHLGIVENTWTNYKKRPEFLSVINRTEQFIKSQQWEGAAVGVFQHNIIARTLGLVEKSETGYRDKDGNPTDPPRPVVITTVFPDVSKDI